MNPSEYFDKAKEKLGLTSDYAFSIEMEISRGALSEMRSGKRELADEYLIFQLAEILEIDAKEIIVDLKSQNEKNPKKRKYWQGIADSAKQKLKGGLIKLRIIKSYVKKK